MTLKYGSQVATFICFIMEGGSSSRFFTAQHLKRLRNESGCVPTY